MKICETGQAMARRKPSALPKKRVCTSRMMSATRMRPCARASAKGSNRRVAEGACAHNRWSSISAAVSAPMPQRTNSTRAMSAGDEKRSGNTASCGKRGRHEHVDVDRLRRRAQARALQAVGGEAVELFGEGVADQQLLVFRQQVGDRVGVGGLAGQLGFFGGDLNVELIEARFDRLQGRRLWRHRPAGDQIFGLQPHALLDQLLQHAAQRFGL